MPDTLYKVPLPESTTPDERDDLGTVLSEQGVLEGDALVEALSSESADLSLRGEFALGSYYSELVATELEELADSSFRALPLFSRDGSEPARAGYYEVDSATVEPAHAAGRSVWSWELDLTAVGTRSTHWLGVTTGLSDDIDTPFASGDPDPPLVALPAAADAVQAVDVTPGPTQRERPDPVETRETAYGDVDLYDPDELSITDPVYLFTAPYGSEPPVDVHVYDTNERDSKYLEAEDGRVRTWQTAFRTGHDFEAGDVVLENGRLRVRFGRAEEGSLLSVGAGETRSLEAGEIESYERLEVDADGTLSVDSDATLILTGTQPADLTAQRWDPDEDIWRPVVLSDTGWGVLDIDLRRIGPLRVEAEVLFADDGGEIVPLEVQLTRGRDGVLFWQPEGVDEELPDGLETLLEPIASTATVDPQPTRTVVARSDVRYE